VKLFADDCGEINAVLSIKKKINNTTEKAASIYSGLYFGGDRMA